MTSKPATPGSLRSVALDMPRMPERWSKESVPASARTGGWAARSHGVLATCAHPSQRAGHVQSAGAASASTPGCIREQAAALDSSRRASTATTATKAWTALEQMNARHERTLSPSTHPFLSCTHTGSA
eukprot:15464801-Alexandrium_andersonii.AAC.1